MPRVTFFLGLAGSGKSYYSERLASETGADVFESLLGDDHKLPALLRCLRSGRDAVVEEIAFCCRSRRADIRRILASIPDVEISWECLENDKESANWNVKRRTNKGDIPGHLDINERVHEWYTYPAGATIKPITRLAGG